MDCIGENQIKIMIIKYLYNFLVRNFTISNRNPWLGDAVPNGYRKISTGTRPGKKIKLTWR